MSSLLPDVESQLFRTNSSMVGKRLFVRMAGCLDMEATPQLAAFLDALIKDIKAGIVNEFEFDASQLYLMSSSSISCFATWIRSLKMLPTRCCVEFKTNPNLGWQRRTLDPLRRLAIQIVSIE